MASLIRKLFKRKRQPPLVCAVSLGEDGNPIGEEPNHVHTGACFVSFEPLAIAELFQSQSCESCPPALSAIHAATTDPNVLLLTFSVTLFDGSGWKDTFSNTRSDNRQRAYAKRWARTSLFTPQVVVDGMSDGTGRTQDEIMAIVQRAREMARQRDWNVYLDANDTEVRIDTNKLEAAPHDVTLVLYTNKDQVVKAGKGPNKGKKINHRNVVTDIIKIGEWRGGDATWALPASRSSMDANTGAVVFVQEGGPGGPIVASANL